MPSAYAPTLLGVLNVSPESAVKESVALSPAAIIEHAEILQAKGAAWIDIGGRSITADVPTISDTEEQARVLGALEALRRGPGPGPRLSVDTWSPDTACFALRHGAGAINYTGGETPSRLLDAVAEHRVPLVLTFMPYGNAYEMRSAKPAKYGMARIVEHLGAKAEMAKRAGVAQVILDPNLGIFHSALDDHEKIHCQLGILNDLGAVKALGHPVLVYAARKPEQLARIMVASQVIYARPDFIRVHDPGLVARLLNCSLP